MTFRMISSLRMAASITVLNGLPAARRRAAKRARRTSSAAIIAVTWRGREM
jgi:hypothetical protein